MSAFVQHEVLGALLISVLVISVLGSAELLKRLTALPREMTRKFAHVGSGMALLSIPLLIHSHWTVLALAVSFIVLMYGTSALGVLGSVHGVGRGVGGVLWYPFTGWLVYFVVFELLERPFVFYAIPVAVLASADAFGAIVGTTYGKHRYEVFEGHQRSLEGSGAFFIVAFFCVHVPLLLAGTTGRAETLLISLVIALLAAMLETVSMYGLDNLLVPFGVLFMLERFSDLGVSSLLLRLGILALCAGIGLVMAWRKPNTMGAAVALVLSAYTIWALGGSAWIGPMAGLLVAFVLYERLSPVQETHSRSRYDMGTVVTGVTVPLALVLLHEFAPSAEARQALYIAFLAALACQASVLFYMMPQNRTFRFKGVRRRVSSPDAWQYRVTPGKLLFALVGSSIPVSLQAGGPPPITAAVLGMLWGIGGLTIFILLASTPRSLMTCPRCGMLTMRGMYCCTDTRLGDGEKLWALNFRKTYLLSNTIAAVAATGLLWTH